MKLVKFTLSMDDLNGHYWNAPQACFNRFGRKGCAIAIPVPFGKRMIGIALLF